MENAQVVTANIPKKTEQKSKSLWRHAFETLLKDKMAVISISIFVAYAIIALLTSVDLIAGDWAKEVGDSYSPPSAEHWFGTDIFGRSVVAKTLKGTQVAMSIGLFTATISAFIGIILGAISGYYGGKVDEIIVWFYTTFSSIPGIMLLVAITFILGKGLVAVYLALGLYKLGEPLSLDQR